MGELEVIRDEIAPFVEKSLEQENVKVEVTGKTEKGENYAGDVIFVKVQLQDGKEVNLVIKMGKKNSVLRDKFNIKEIYLRELRVYDEIFPAFKKFQHDKNVAQPFNAIPKCYGTHILENNELFIMENLKNRGFEMHDRQKTFNQSHLELVLKNYAKFHAISFAMQDQNKTQFEDLTKNYTCMPELIFIQPQMEMWYFQRVTSLIKVLNEEDPDLIKRTEQFFEPGALNIMTDILKMDIKERVIIHGDCWNSNFMFKYKDDNKETPIDMAMLDWQISSLHSPALDLSYFLHIVLSGEQLEKIDKILHFYHKHLSDFLAELGSDPENLFPYSILKEHWNKCAPYGLIMAVNSLEMMMCDKNDAIDLEDFGEDAEADMEKWVNSIKAKHEPIYRKRIVGIIRAHLNWKNNN